LFPGARGSQCKANTKELEGVGTRVLRKKRIVKHSNVAKKILPFRKIAGADERKGAFWEVEDFEVERGGKGVGVKPSSSG